METAKARRSFQRINARFAYSFILKTRCLDFLVDTCNANTASKPTFSATLLKEKS